MYERNYELLKAKFGEFFLPTLFTSMAGNICLFVDGLLVSFLIGASNISAIQIVTPVITFVNLKHYMQVFADCVDDINKPKDKQKPIALTVASVLATVTFLLASLSLFLKQ